MTTPVTNVGIQSQEVESEEARAARAAGQARMRAEQEASARFSEAARSKQASQEEMARGRAAGRMAAETAKSTAQREFAEEKAVADRFGIQRPIVPDFEPVIERGREQAEKSLQEAQKQTESLIQEREQGVVGIQRKLQEDTEKLKAKATEETEKQIARQEAIRVKVDEENLKRRAIETRAITNTFSQQLAAGKDSGFVNALNMASVRSANKTYADSKLNLDLQFMQDTNNIYNREFDTVFRLEEGLINKITDLDIDSLDFSTKMKQDLNEYKRGVQEGLNQTELNVLENNIKYTFEAEQDMKDEWNTSAKSLVDGLLESGNIDEAIQFAEEASEISAHPYFKLMLNPAIRDSLVENRDTQLMAQWSGNLNSINQLTINASTMNPTMQQESIEKMFTLMAETPNQATRMMNNFLSNMTEEDLDRYDVSDEDREVIDEFVAGDRSFDDNSVKEVFGDLYIRDARREADEAEFKAMIDAANIPEFIEQSPVGNEIVIDWVKGGMATNNYMDVDIDTDNVFGEADISRIQFFNRTIDPQDLGQLGTLPGIDIAFEGFQGDEGTDNSDPDIWTTEPPYQPKDAAGDKTIGGQDYENTDLVDSYLEYYKKFSEKWSGATTEDRALMGDPLNKDQWSQQLRIENQKNDEKTDLKDFNDNLLKDPDVIETVEEVGYTIPKEISSVMSDIQREVFTDVIGGEDVNEIDDRDFGSMMSVEGAYDELRRQNDDDSLFIDADTVNLEKLERGRSFEGVGHQFSKDNLADTLGKLNKESDELFTGNIMYGGEPHKIEVTPGRHKSSRTAVTWYPVADIRLIPINGGDDTNISTKITSKGKSKDENLVLARAKEFFEEL